MKRFFLASNSVHKAREFSALVEVSAKTTGTPVIEIISASSMGGLPPVREDAGTLAGNARQKAIALQGRLPLDAWVLADDSGLFVDALFGAPGVDSAIFAGTHGDDAANLQKLIGEMRRIPVTERSARFVCVLMVRGPQGIEKVFEAACAGTLLIEPRGTKGFGYDPIFVPNGCDQALAEMEPKVKNQLSHRGLAWTKFMRWLEECG